jgi:hypothetical protein
LLLLFVDAKLTESKHLILSGIKPLVESETNIDAKRVLAQVVIAMASQGYLALEGGESLVEFIVRQSAITDQEVEAFDKAVCTTTPNPNNNYHSSTVVPVSLYYLQEVGF